MAKISDFAQKLLDDLRLRKERMAASQSSKGTNPMVAADAYAYSKTAYKSSRESKTLKTEDTTEKVSNQIVPFGSGQKSEHIGNLSMALAFAIENGGKLRAESSGKSSIFSFCIAWVGNRWVTERWKEETILKACSNGLNFDRYLIEIGRELLKGARDLEESLGMLVKLQEDSEYMIRPQRKSRITLLEEDEDDDENTVKIVDQMQLGRPRFSNYNDIQGVARTDLRLRLAALTYSSDVSDSKHKNDVLAPQIHILTSDQLAMFQTPNLTLRSQNKAPPIQRSPQRWREIQKVVGVVTKTPAKDTKKAEQGTKDSAALAHRLPPIKEKATTASKTPLTQDKNFKDIKPVTSLRKALIKVDKQQGDINHLNLNSGNRKEIQEKESEQNSIKYREKKGIERIDIKKPVLILKDGMQHMIPHVHKTSEFALTLQEKPEYSECIPQRESRHANKLLLGNQQKLQSNHGFQGVQMLQKSELRGKKQQSELKEEQSTEQKLQRKKQKGNELFSKPMSGATNLQKKQPQMKQAETSRKGPSKHIDVTKLNGFPGGRHSQNLARAGSSKIKGSLDRNSGQHYTQGVIESESAKDQNLFAMDEKPVQGQTTMKARTINVYKHGSSISQDMEKARQEKLAISSEADQMKTSRFEEVEPQIIRSNKSSVEAQKNSILCSPLEDGCQSLNELQALAWRENCQNSVPLVTKEQQDQEPDFGKAEELKFKNNISEPLHVVAASDASFNVSGWVGGLGREEGRRLSAKVHRISGTREESREIPCTPQSQYQRTCASEMPEPLTERQESKLVLDCGYEVMKSKGIRQELSVHPFLKVTIIPNKEKTLDELVKQISEDIDKLKLYRRGRRENSPFEDYLPKMLEADVNNKEPHLNCMWDKGRNSMMFAFLEKDDVVRDAEKYVLNGLLDEMTRDIFTG
ncbi:hypothetical protein Godav_009003, partial [Gossypium davidsonii]|nr:hypothetical protein [Gossypium davidsonii]